MVTLRTYPERSNLPQWLFDTWSLWKRRDWVSQTLHLRLYNAFIMPILTYNAGTWGLTDVTLKSLDAFHRRQLRSLLGIKWPETISNAALYRRCCSEPISDVIKRLRWQLFGHILRLDEDTPARMAMANYFDGRNQTRWQGRPRTTLTHCFSD